MSVSCCYQCPRRHVGCQAGCPDREKEIAKRKKEDAARKAFLRQESDIGASKKAMRRAVRGR